MIYRYSMLTMVTCIALSLFCDCKASKKKKKEGNDDVPAAVGKADLEKFDFTKPTGKWMLPEDLVEISGIVKLEGKKMLAIEDLHPLLYILDLNDSSGTITDSIQFYETSKDKFDMEDVAMIGDTVYGLWSHGTLFKIKDWKKTRQVEKIKTGLSKENNTEGLAYDPVSGNLLIACKNESDVEDEKKSTRSIFEFDVKADSLKDIPFLLIEKKDLNNISGDKVDFYPSAVAVHPITHDVYVMSTRSTKCIAQYSHDGQLKAFCYLDKDMFLQPEGMCFDAAGNFYISTEGKHGVPPYIYEFAPVKNK